MVAERLTVQMTEESIRKDTKRVEQIAEQGAAARQSQRHKLIRAREHGHKYVPLPWPNADPKAYHRRRSGRWLPSAERGGVPGYRDPVRRAAARGGMRGRRGRQLRSSGQSTFLTARPEGGVGRARHAFADRGVQEVR